MTKQEILDTMTDFINQRPGLEFDNYGDRFIYQSDYRTHCAKPKKDFIKLAESIAWRDGITADDLRQAFRRAFGGRLSMLDDGTLDYTPGQCGALEYRHAACSVLSSVLWDYWRTDAPKGITPREHITRTAKREFGRGIASRYFD